MSFFIRKAKHKLEPPPAHNRPTLRKLSERSVPDKRRKLVVDNRKQVGRTRHGDNPPDDEEITSEEDEEEEDPSIDDDDDEDDHETEQETRIRIAKHELATLKQKLEDEHDDEVDDDIVGATLKENILLEEGRVLRKNVADKFSHVSATVAFSGGKVLKSPITSMAVDPITMTIYLSTKSGKIMRILNSLSRHVTVTPPPVTSLSVSNGILAAATRTRIIVLNPETLKINYTFKTLNAVNLSVCKETIFSTHKDRTIKLWNTEEHSFVEALFGHQDTPTCVDSVMIGGNVTCVSGGGFDKTLRAWKISTESQLVYNWGEEDIIDVVKVISAGVFVAGGCSGKIGLFSFNRKKPLVVVPTAHGVDEFGNPRWITAIGVHKFTDMFVSGSYSGDAKVWRIGDHSKSLECVNSVAVGNGVVVGVEVVSDSAFLVAVSTEMVSGRWNGRVGKKCALFHVK